ncbi:MAG TPA: CbbQ/NirQ/NorQ/GpvN family protein [Nitrospiria bacterium]|nr:CbbQ/NirQ/NorQ/GpvN family protein [Nitrospiria bacterium]
MSSRPLASETDITQYHVRQEPYYVPVQQEVELFEAAYANQLPVMLKGPTGCGKSRFVQHMAYRLKRPLITVACHEDVTASDLVGRFLLRGEETVWADGPVALAVRHGAICYLDEVVEARKDTTVVIHPLTDARRILPIEKKAELLEAGREFMLVISYNPGYQSVVKELKQSTKQRFIAVEFDYPKPEIETRIIQHESGVGPDVAAALVRIGEKVRHLKHHGLEEGVSTRLLVYAGTLIRRGIPPHAACEAAIAKPLTDDPDIQRSIRELVSAIV